MNAEITLLLGTVFLGSEILAAQARLINKVKHLLRRHNLQWEMPTKRFPTLRAIAWLKGLSLPAIDQLELNHLLVDLELALPDGEVDLEISVTAGH